MINAVLLSQGRKSQPGNKALGGSGLVRAPASDVLDSRLATRLEGLGFDEPLVVRKFGYGQPSSPAEPSGVGHVGISVKCDWPKHSGSGFRHPVQLRLLVVFSWFCGGLGCNYLPR